MPSFSNITIVGHLARSPDLRVTDQGLDITKFTVAVNHRKEAAFIDCTSFGKAAQNIAKYTDKGDPILINGYIQQERWTAKDGSPRNKLSVIVNAYQFLGRGDSEKEIRKMDDPDNDGPSDNTGNFVSKISSESQFVATATEDGDEVPF
tara:strand:+ start:797 stop:1243 length:447 start_codon:yes stop_codon:yes gene_type:complete